MRLRSPSGLTLLVRFTVTSALIGASFALTLGWLVGHEVARAALTEAVATTAQAADMLLTPYLVKGDFAHSLWPSRLDDLDRLIGRHLNDRGIIQVRLWNHAGVVVYSNDRGLINQRSAAPRDMKSALGGRVAAAISPAVANETGPERSVRRVLKVYAPVRLLAGRSPEGVYEVHRDAAPVLASVQTARVRAWLWVFAGTIALYACLFGLVRRASSDLVAQQQALREAFEGTIRALAAAVDARDAYTGGHSSQVSVYAVAIARGLGLSEQDIQVVKMAGYLHDLGKIGIPDEILRKTGRFDEKEWATIRRHSLIGFHILEPVHIDERIKLAVKHAHERWDGSGYPDRLAGEAIPIHARILVVADAFEAMTSDRPYRNALSTGHAIQELQRNAGTQFDPHVVKTFLVWLGEPKADAYPQPRAAFNS
ncbi:MAG: HD-GYP domain-containing protein [Armatimonadota bacterium]